MKDDRIAELEAENAIFRAADYEALKNAEEVNELNARIAELERQAIVWHKYPDEKPDKYGWYLTSYKNQIRLHFWDAKRVFFDTNPTNIPYVSKLQPTRWAYLPEPPRGKA